MENTPQKTQTKLPENKKEKPSKQKYSIFNDQYQVVDILGHGKTSKVYLATNIKDPSDKVALKLLKQEYLDRDETSIKSIEQEIQILNGLNHKHINLIIGYGSDGKILKPSGREIKNLVYIMLEYVSGGLFFDMCQAAGAMGEQGGRFFMDQLKDVIGFMHDKKVVHRDLKLENILLDQDLNLKIADFGFATYKKIGKLKSFRGTKTYMAPEIKEGKVYDGRAADIFSIGVILFIIVQGIFPFSEATNDEYYYKLILKGNYEKYWRKTGAKELSDEFKDLFIKMVHPEPAKRLTIEEIKKHDWFKKPFEITQAKQKIIELLKENKYELSTNSTTSTKSS